MDVKMNNISLDLLGMRLTIKLPRISIKDPEEEEAAEYHLKIEESQNRENEDSLINNKMTYMEWRYGDKLQQMTDSSKVEETKTEVVRVKELPRLERATVARNNMMLSTRRSREQFQRSRLLKYDQRVVNRLMTVEQIGHIEQWLNNQPDSFTQQTTDDAENVYETVDDDAPDSPRKDDPEDDDVPTVDLDKSTNFYRHIANSQDRLVYYRKVSIV